MIKRVSLKDIAVKVGVSTALVSYVLNGQEKGKKVSRELADKIRNAAAELNSTKKIAVPQKRIYKDYRTDSCRHFESFL
jgi:DNA-binding LacI/PurR family transcriptional regulator